MTDQGDGCLREPDDCTGERSWLQKSSFLTVGRFRRSMDDVVLAAYDAAVGSKQWREVATYLSEALDGKALLLFFFDARSNTAEILARTPAEAQHHIESHLAIARRTAAAYGLEPSGAEGGRSRVLNAGSAPDKVAEWNSLGDANCEFYVSGRAVGGLADGLWLCIGVDTGDHAISEEVHEKVVRLLPHFCRAIEIERSLVAAGQRSSYSDAIFDRLPFGLVQFDRNASVLYANAEAERISRSREGFTIVERRARAASAADDVALQNALRETIAVRKGPSARWLNVRRGKEHRPYRMLVTAVPTARDSGTNMPGCVLFITDPERQSTFDTEAVVSAFDLTAGEARVVARLATGASLPDIADSLNVSINTVRTLLARAMGKTATNTQVALVRLVLTTLCIAG